MFKLRSVLFLLFFFLLSCPASRAQLPWSRIYVDSAGGIYAAPQLLANAAVFQFPGGQRTKVVIVPIKPVSKVQLLLDCGADGVVFYPHLMGLMVAKDWLAARSEWDWQGDEADDWRFPGQAFAPLVAHYAGSTGYLIADVDGESCRPLYTRKRIALLYEFDPPLLPGQVTVFNGAVVKATAPTARQAMHSLLAAYREHFRDDLEYPELQPLHGYLNIQLQDQDRPLQHVARLWADHGDDFRRIQFWGWTSDRFDGTNATSCCLKSGVFHARYTLAFGNLVSTIYSDGLQTAFYFRADDANLDDYLAALDPWRSLYVDVAGFWPDVRSSYGRPGTIVEGLSVACDEAALTSGSVTGGMNRIPGGSRAHEEPVPWFARLIFRRPVFLGDSNYDYAWTDAVHGYRTYREAFLLGAKFDWRGTPNPIIPAAIAEWKRANFWARKPVYRDAEGLAGVPAGVDVRRFLDIDGKTILAVDNPSSVAEACTVDGKNVALPAQAIALVEVP